MKEMKRWFFLVALSLILVPTTIAAAKIEISDSSSLPYEVVSAKLHAKRGELILVLRNLAPHAVSPAFIFDQLGPKGQVLASNSFIAPTMSPFGKESIVVEPVLTARTTMRTRFQLEASVADMTETLCDMFCDLCWERAEAQCTGMGGGVKAYSCACSASERHCRFTCFLPE